MLSTRAIEFAQFIKLAKRKPYQAPGTARRARVHLNWSSNSRCMISSGVSNIAERCWGWD